MYIAWTIYTAWAKELDMAWISFNWIKSIGYCTAWVPQYSNIGKVSTDGKIGLPHINYQVNNCVPTTDLITHHNC